MQITRIEERCNRCMLCVKDCSSRVWQDIGGIPTPAAPELCNLCSHCASVCPRDAVRHDRMDMNQVRRVDRKRIDPVSFRETALSRRSVRHYKDRPVSRTVMEDILDLAHHSPTASNEQNVGFVVVTDKKILTAASSLIFGLASRWHERTRKGLGKLLADITGLSGNRYLKLMDLLKRESGPGKDFILHNAPTMIVIHTPEKARFGCDNCNIAAGSIINYAHALGLGTCFIGFMILALNYSKKMRKLVQLPEGRKAHACIVIGYPAYSHVKTASRKRVDITWV